MMKKSNHRALAAEPTTSGNSLQVLTVGHSTRTIEEFIGLLQAHGVTCVADVRTIPRSRRNPQYNTDSLERSLEQAGIDYVHLPNLGGLRRPRPDSQNLGWRNASFRGFADHMQTPKFKEALAELEALATRKLVALMCAEAVPWRCHRSLIADALLAHGIRVEHIMSPTTARRHELPSFAKIEHGQVTYPLEESRPLRAA